MKERKKERKFRERRTDLARWPADAVLTSVDAVDDELAAATTVVDGILENLDAAGGLDHDVEAVGVLLVKLLEHGLRVRSAQGQIGVGSIEFLGQFHLKPFGSDNDDVAAAVLTEHLGENEASRPGAEHEDGGSHLGGDLVQTVSSAGGRLEESGIDVGEILDGEDSAGCERERERERKREVRSERQSGQARGIDASIPG
jgi:hypothetical protein